MNLIEHKKARLDYEILEEYEAGLELLGLEVKSLRSHHGKLEGAHIIVRPTSPRLRGASGGKEAYIVGMHIPPYQPGNTPKEYDPNRTRKLLLTHKEIGAIAGAEGQKGLTVVPISLYNKGKVLKLRIAVARGRKKYDKRAVLKARDTKREIDRTLKNR
jgi:SsrA-binding protein